MPHLSQARAVYTERNQSKLQGLGTGLCTQSATGLQTSRSLSPGSHVRLSRVNCTVELPVCRYPRQPLHTVETIVKLIHEQSASAMPCSENTTPIHTKTISAPHAPFVSGPAIPWPYLETLLPIASDRDPYYSSGGPGRPARMIRYDAQRDEILLYISASCLDRHDAEHTRRAASSYVFKPTGSHPSETRSLAFRLEQREPTGQMHPRKGTHALLRATVGSTGKLLYL